jgi:hypothetical protein
VGDIVLSARFVSLHRGHAARASATLDAVPVPACRPSSLLLAAAIVGLSALTQVLAVAPARADQLAVEEREGETGYAAVEELSYEAILEPSDGYTATMHIRVALHNNARTARDAVLSVAMPRGSQLQGMQIAKNGAWVAGLEAAVHHDPDRRDPGSVFARQLPAGRGDRLPAAEVVAFGLGPGLTTQVELTMSVHPRLRGDRWELELPARGVDLVTMSADRRVLVKGLRKTEEFWVDEQASGTDPAIVTSSRDTVTVAWPAHLQARAPLEGRLEVMPGPPGFDDGEVRLYVRLGQTDAPRPDHVVLAVDRSLSTSTRMQRETQRFAGALLDALPASTTFDAIGWNRKVEPLLITTGSRAPKVDDAAARRSLAANLDANVRGQGSDLSEALRDAAARARRRSAKRPTIVVVTDGMLPYSIDGQTVRDALQEGWGRGKPPEVLFVVDDPMLLRRGLEPSHPVARVAAELGARISLETLETVQPDRALDLLAAPRVLGDLAFTLPENVKLRDAVPAGLVAGGFVLLRGDYVGDPPGDVTLHGSFAGSKIDKKLKAATMPRRPEAFAASTEGDAAEAATEGFVRPPWYAADEQRTAEQSITQVSRGGRQVKGRLDKRIFRHYLTTRVLPRSRVCYNHALQRDRTQAGRVELRFEIGKGEVMLASADGTDLAVKDTKLVDCLLEAAWALDIPAGKLDDRIYLLKYPLALVPPADAEVSGEIEGISEAEMDLLLGDPNAPGAGAAKTP